MSLKIIMNKREITRQIKNYAKKLYEEFEKDTKKLIIPTTILAGGTWADICTTYIGVKDGDIFREKNPILRYLMQNIGIEEALLLNGLTAIPVAYSLGKLSEFVREKLENKKIRKAFELTFLSTENWMYGMGIPRYFLALWNTGLIDPIYQYFLKLTNYNPGTENYFLHLSMYTLLSVPFLKSFLTSYLKYKKRRKI